MKNRGFLSRTGVDLLSVKADVVTPPSPDFASAGTQAAQTPEAPAKRPRPLQSGSPRATAPQQTKKGRGVTGESFKKTLHLRISTEANDLLSCFLADLDDPTRILTKRQMVSAFRLHLMQSKHQPDPEHTGEVPYRIDIRLPAELVSNIFEQEHRNPFEPLATALARGLSHRFDSYIRSALNE